MVILYVKVHLDSQVDRDDDKADLGDSNYDEFSGYSGLVAQDGGLRLYEALACTLEP